MSRRIAYYYFQLLDHIVKNVECRHRCSPPEWVNTNLSEAMAGGRKDTTHTHNATDRSKSPFSRGAMWRAAPLVQNASFVYTLQHTHTFKVLSPKKKKRSQCFWCSLLALICHNSCASLPCYKNQRYMAKPQPPKCRLLWSHCWLLVSYVLHAARENKLRRRAEKINVQP